MTTLSQLYNGDMLEILKTLPANSIDACITDPPYGTNDGRGKTIKRGSSHTNFSVMDWDRSLPLQYLLEIERIMKPDTWGAIFTDNMAISYVWSALEGYGLRPRNTFYWIKYNKAPTPRSNFKSCVETAVFFTKGRTTIKWNGGGNQPNYIDMPFVTGNERVDHPTQKPIKLMRHIIKLVTDEGDIVIDPFMGSGTTGCACALDGRNFVGIEINKEYFDIAQKRIEQCEKQSAQLKLI